MKGYRNNYHRLLVSVFMFTIIMLEMNQDSLYSLHSSTHSNHTSVLKLVYEGASCAVQGCHRVTDMHITLKCSIVYTPDK